MIVAAKKIPTKKGNTAHKEWFEQMLEKRQRDTNLVIHIIRKKHNVEFNDTNEPPFGIAGMYRSRAIF